MSALSIYDGCTSNPPSKYHTFNQSIPFTYIYLLSCYSASRHLPLRWLSITKLEPVTVFNIGHISSGKLVRHTAVPRTCWQHTQYTCWYDCTHYVEAIYLCSQWRLQLDKSTLSVDREEPRGLVVASDDVLQLVVWRLNNITSHESLQFLLTYSWLY